MPRPTSGYLLPIASQLMAETDRAGWLPAALDECRVMQHAVSEVVDPAEAWRYRQRLAAAYPPAGLFCSCWRSGACAKRASATAVNFVVREEHLWSVARYMPTSLGELDSLGLSGSEIRFHGKTLISLVEKSAGAAGVGPAGAAAEPIDMPGYRKVFKDIKALVQEVSTEKGRKRGLLASRRQINQLLNWHWQLKAQAGEPELISGWRGELMAERLKRLLNDYPALVRGQVQTIKNRRRVA